MGVGSETGRVNRSSSCSVTSRACATSPRIPTPPSYTRTCTGASSLPPKSWAKSWPSSESFGNWAQPAKFDLVVSLNTAKILGLAIPPAVLGRADEIIR
jgi:hypothetical protein